MRGATRRPGRLRRTLNGAYLVRQSHRLLAFGFALAVATPAGAQSANNDSLVTSMIDMIMDPSRWHCVAPWRCRHLRQLAAAAIPVGRGRDSRQSVAWPSAAAVGSTSMTTTRSAWTTRIPARRCSIGDWSGTGSNLLNVSNIGNLTSNVVTVSANHYFVGSRSWSARTPVSALPVRGLTSAPTSSPPTCLSMLLLSSFRLPAAARNSASAPRRISGPRSA